MAFFADRDWLIEIVIGVVLLIIANYGLKGLVKLLRKKAHPDKHDWREKIGRVVYLPVDVIFWILGVAYVIGGIAHHLGFGDMVAYLPAFRDVAIFVCLAWLLFRWKIEAQHHLTRDHGASRHPLDPGVVRVIGKLGSIVIVVITAILILQRLGVDIVPLVAFGGIGAAAVGFAGKDVIANFFGGLMLYITRPFFEGEQIMLPDRDIEGTVEEIGWYLTCIRNKDKRPVYLPNAFFSTMLVINYSRMSHRRIRDTIALSYDDVSKVDSIALQIRRFLTEHPGIDATLPIQVHLDRFNAYSVDLLIEVYTDPFPIPENYYALRQEVLLAIYDLVVAAGAKMPFPTTSIELHTL